MREACSSSVVTGRWGHACPAILPPAFRDRSNCHISQGLILSKRFLEEAEDGCISGQ